MKEHKRRKYTKKGLPFLIRQEKNFASSPVIGMLPSNIPQINAPVQKESKSSTSFGDLLELNPFNVTPNCCQDVDNPV